MMVFETGKDLVISGDFINYLWYPLVSGLVILFVGWLLNHKNKKRTDDIVQRVESTKYEITNEHDQPLRNDLDSKFDVVFSKLNKVAATQARHDRLFKKMGLAIIGVRKDVAGLTNDQTQSIKDIEDLRRELDRREGDAQRQPFPSE